VKIFEIITEADSAYEKGKAFGQRLVSPSQWFNSDNSSDDEPETVQDKPKKPVEVNPNRLRDTINSLLRDEPRYNEDIALLKNFYTELETGKFNTSVDKSALMQSVKTAYTGGQLSQNNKKTLVDFVATL
jgi:hypothetical protein